MLIFFSFLIYLSEIDLLSPPLICKLFNLHFNYAIKCQLNFELVTCNFFVPVKTTIKAHGKPIIDRLDDCDYKNVRSINSCS